jgi:hypothetical protein
MRQLHALSPPPEPPVPAPPVPPVEEPLAPPVADPPAPPVEEPLAPPVADPPVPAPPVPVPAEPSRAVPASPAEPPVPVPPSGRASGIGSGIMHIPASGADVPPSTHAKKRRQSTLQSQTVTERPEQQGGSPFNLLTSMILVRPALLTLLMSLAKATYWVIPSGEPQM